MIDYKALRVLAASAGTRVHALVSDTCFVVGAICAQNALGSALSVRVAVVFRNAGANSVGALSVGAAWGRVARVFDFRFDF